MSKELMLNITREFKHIKYTFVLKMYFGGMKSAEDNLYGK